MASSSRARQKHWRYLRETGNAALMRRPEVEALVDKIKALHARGMSYKTMAAQTGVPQATISGYVTAPGRGMLRTTYVKLARLRFAENEVSERGARLDPTGTRRRLQGLWADGFSLEWIRRELGGFNDPYLRRLLHGRDSSHVHADVASRIAALYDKLDGVEPADAGMTKHGITYARNQAVKHGYPPRSCWDPDTIDDPDAIPEWTGQCGTVFGWRIHETQEIPLCRPCADARSASDAELSGAKLRDVRVRRGLSQEQLARAAGVKVDKYRSWESNRTKPRFQKDLDLVLGVLDVTYDEVVE